MSKIGKIVIVAAFVGLFLVVSTGFREDGYLKYVQHMPDPQPYPISGVAFFSAVVLVESVLLYALLRHFTIVNVAIRFLATLLTFIVLAVLFVLCSMHQAPYYFGHLLWLFAIVVFLLVALIGSTIRIIRMRA